MHPDTQFLTEHDLENEEGLSHLSLILAHRLRGLVAGIEGFADLLTDTLVTREQRELALKIMEGTARIESVLADLQLYGELQDPTMLPVRVDDIFRDVLVPLAPADQARIEIRNEVAGTILMADPFLIRQALLILIQNALDANRKAGSILLESRSTSASVHFDVWNGGVVEVDNAAHRVFVPFFTTKAQNLGVGLPIARRIARLHGGTVELTANSLEEGTRFTFTVPTA